MVNFRPIMEVGLTDNLHNITTYVLFI